MLLHRNCKVCGKPFTTKRIYQKYCSQDCYKKISNRYSSREKYEEGIIYVLDMERWEWIKEERGNKNG